MSRSLFLKVLAIGVLALLLLIPLSMVSGMVSDRQMFREQAIKSISDGTAGSQLLAGPVWVLPYRQQVQVTASDNSGATHTAWRDFQVRVLPDKLAVGGRLRTEMLRRGIYETQRYTADLTVKGHFVLPANAGLAADATRQWGQPYLSVGVQDVRGIKASPTTEWGKEKVGFAPGAKLKALGSGIHAMLPNYDGNAVTVPFSFKLTLDGMDDLSLLPLGRDTEVSLQSDWQTPSFFGRFLPENRDYGPQGFTARWRASWFSSNLSEHFENCVQSNECDPFRGASMGVRLVEPVDVYLQSERAVKYGFLFVFLTFCTFFLTEVLKRVSIHPVQYGLVGMSLAVFFLLLLSFAEQWSFTPAYLLAATACVAQNGFYAAHALGSRLRGLAFAALLAGLYAMLFVLLRSADHALLLGSILLFGLLTAAMVLTRKLDWYGLNNVEEK
ncbi:cell envelope integrity protein CreD [Chitinimonas arctica]|uniref:Cell envelope integrity protein CreD n=1 Tax=Chitinimonas arctica TaxID=2594795 RepID=A0A516SG18_9NEIS|nr:cell envelope integrity protein CreD [Chitinimonas arctica]QDQ27103.1 cell envelope integrity protein CreD [Chitinimonas arctica]